MIIVLLGQVLLGQGENGDLSSSHKCDIINSVPISRSMTSSKEWETNIDRNQVNIYIEQNISTNHANNEINIYLYILQSWNPIRGRVIKNPGKERGEDRRLNDAGVTNEWLFKLGPVSGPSFCAQWINNQIRQKIQVTLDSIFISRRTYKSFHDPT